MKNPLVSIPVITYNSAETVLETLESIKEQTYPNIELIVSDDCSPDNTVELCRKWIEQNKGRFVRAEILTVEKNTGVSANLNRAEASCRGDWVKGIAGDDILLPDCIETMVKYINVNPVCVCVFSKMLGFGRNEDETNEYMSRVFDYSFFELTVEEQYKRLVLKGNCIPAPTCFYNLNKFKLLGIKNDERIPMVEDYPKWLNLTQKGVKLDFLNETLVKYRLSESSISTTRTPSLRAKESISLIYLHYLFLPRFKFNKSLYKKLGELRKYIYAANTAWGGLFWSTFVNVDKFIAIILNIFGIKVKV